MTTPSAAGAVIPAQSAGQADAPRRSRRPGGADLLMLVPVIAELVVGGYRLGNASLWRDEADTLSAATRPVGDILALMGHQDAVHGVYYVLMHVVVAVLGTSATALRLPSLLATSAAAGLTAVLGRRLAMAARLPAPAITGMAAGLLLVALPVTTFYAQDARPYALATLLAVAATYLLVRGLGDGRRRWWAGYGAAVALLAAMNLLALLIIAAHGVTLLLTRRDNAQDSVARRAQRGWFAASAAAIACAAPLIAVSQGQTAQLSWLVRPHAGSIVTLLADFSGTRRLIPVVAGLAVLCVLAGLTRWRHPGCTLTSVALPWLVLPPAILLGVSELRPIYDDRYVLFCSPAMALLAAGGLATLASLIATALSGLPRWLPAAAPVLIAALITGLVVAPQQQARLTSARPDDLRAAASVVAAHDRPGDAVLYVPWSAKVVSEAYPAPFSRLRDIALRVSPDASATLRGVPVGSRELIRRFAAVTRVWVVYMGGNGFTRTRLGRTEARLLGALRLIRTWKITTITLSLYLRR